MAAPRKGSDSDTPKRPPARSPEERQNQLINMAYDYAEEQFRTGKATSQLATHFLKYDAAEQELKLLKMKYEMELSKARAESISRLETGGDLAAAALRALGAYRGEEPDENLNV